MLAILIDWGLPALSGVEHWQLVPAHFAERHNLVIILALGETVIAIGAGTTVDLTAPTVLAVGLGIGLAATFWWTYFDVVAIVTERRLAQANEGADRNTLARDSYSYLHFPMVAGIIVTALGVHETLAHVDKPLDTVHAVALLGGSALYLLAHVVLRLRNAHTISPTRLGAAIVLVALDPRSAARRCSLRSHRSQRRAVVDHRLRGLLRLRRTPLPPPPRSRDRRARLVLATSHRHDSDERTHNAPSMMAMESELIDEAWAALTDGSPDTVDIDRPELAGETSRCPRADTAAETGPPASRLR